MKKIKIGFLEYSDIFSGAEMSLHSLIKYLDTEKFEPTIYFRYPQEHQSRYSDLECNKHYICNEKKWWMGSDRWKNPLRGTDFLKRFIFGFKLAWLAKKEQIDIIHINLIRPDSLWWALWPKLFGFKVIGHSRSDTMHWIPSKTLQKQCTAIVCVSDFVKSKVLSKYVNGTAFTVYDAVDYSFYKNKTTKSQALTQLGFSPNQKILASVGLLSPHKGHDMAIKVFAEIANEYKDYTLLIAGGGRQEELERLEQLTHDLNIEDRVLFTRKQISNVTDVYYAAEIIFSLTTRGEAFGRVPFEGNACGSVVLTPNKGAAIELINDNENGFLVDPLDRDKIVEKTTYILSHPQEVNKVIQEGQKYFSQLLSPLSSARSIEKVYLSLLKESDA